jgi:membrane-associated protein
MEWMAHFIDLFLHLDKHLNLLAGDYGVWTYLILFLIVFCETGLVVTPFLPGDSLLFAVGALAASEGSVLDVWFVIGLLTVAAILGDTLNYQIGHVVGPRVFTNHGRFFKKEHLDRTHRFFEKYGGKTIIFARFVPIVRTFAPFVAGIGAMTYWKFLAYNVIGGVLWVFGFVLAGYFFGNIPVVKRNFTLVIFAIIFLSILPGVIEFVRSRRAIQKEAAMPSEKATFMFVSGGGRVTSVRTRSSGCWLRGTMWWWLTICFVGTVRRCIAVCRSRSWIFGRRRRWRTRWVGTGLSA